MNKSSKYINMHIKILDEIKCFEKNKMRGVRECLVSIGSLYN